MLASTPTTILPFTVALVLTADRYKDVAQALCSAPVGILLASVYLTLWRELLRLRLVSAISSIRQQLLAVLLVCLTFWASGAIALTCLLDTLKQHLAAPVTGCIAAVLSAVVGILAVFVRQVPAPGGKKAITWLSYFGRGCLAGLAVGVSLLLTSVSPSASGIGSVFPSITTTTLVSLWLQQGKEVAVGAAGPLALGNVSISVFCLLFAGLYPELANPGVPHGLSITATCLVAYCITVTCVSAPLFCIIHRSQRLMEVAAECL